MMQKLYRLYRKNKRVYYSLSDDVQEVFDSYNNYFSNLSDCTVQGSSTGFVFNEFLDQVYDLTFLSKVRIFTIPFSQSFVKVKYYNNPLGTPWFKVTGQPLRTVLTIYGWLPNGSITYLGMYRGLGFIDLDYNKLLQFFTKWFKHMI